MLAERYCHFPIDHGSHVHINADLKFLLLAFLTVFFIFRGQKVLRNNLVLGAGSKLFETISFWGEGFPKMPCSKGNKKRLLPLRWLPRAGPRSREPQFGVFLWGGGTTHQVPTHQHWWYHAQSSDLNMSPPTVWWSQFRAICTHGLAGGPT